MQVTEPGNDEKTLKSLRFDSNITDEQLKEFLAPCEVVRIERGSWMSDVYLYSDEPSKTLSRKLQERFENGGSKGRNAARSKVSRDTTPGWKNTATASAFRQQ